MFWRKKIAIIVILILTVTIGLLYSYFGIEAKYTSYTTILLKQENIYFAGEILDVDGICGGYNLHFAWASGMMAGVASAR